MDSGAGGYVTFPAIGVPAMPRYTKQRIDYTPSVPSLVQIALHERPFVPRNYADHDLLVRLRERLFAVESWADRVTASIQSRLMVAASIQPHMLAGIFDQLAQECARAAPARPVGEEPQDPCVLLDAIRDPSRRGKVSAIEATQSRADHLIYAIELLGEFVAGSWRWVPCWTGSDGGGDENGPWELEYSPPSDAVTEILREMSLGECGGNGRQATREAIEVIDERIRRRAASATSDLLNRLDGTIAGVTMADLAQSLGDDGRHLLPLHQDLIACVDEMHRAAQPDAEPMGSWWTGSQVRLQAALAHWLEQVPRAIPMTRNRRQQLKRDVASAFAYVSQYTWLLRANHASQQLVNMIDLLNEICARLGRVLEDLGHGARETARSGGDVGVCDFAWSRALVAEEDEKHWRQGLGPDVDLAAEVVAVVVGETGQEEGLQIQQVCDALAVHKGLEIRPYSEPEVERVLAKMQELGLATRLPADLLRPVGSAGRSAPRRRAHVGRTWWVNPLGEILAAQDR